MGGLGAFHDKPYWALPRTVPPLAWNPVMAAGSGHPHGMRPRSGTGYHPKGDRTHHPVGG